MASNSRKVRGRTRLAVLFAAVLIIGAAAFAQAPVRVSIPGTTFTGATTNQYGRSVPVRSSDVPGGRRFIIEPGTRVTLTGSIQMPRPILSDGELERLVVHFRTSRGGPELQSLELNDGPRKVYQFSTRLSGDYLTTEKGNAWTFQNTRVSPQWVMNLRVSLGSGIDSVVPAGDFVLTTVEADFHAKPGLSIGRVNAPSVSAAKPAIAPVAPNAMIYAVTNDNDLLWYGHSGREVGGFTWASPVGQPVGHGWNFKQVFPGDDGVIYAITPGGDLMWYRHDGRLDGTFRWTSEGKKVGSGWNYDHVFAGGGGVIYAITTSGDLLWFRHDGRLDGTDRWAPTPSAGRRVGVGWIFKQVFAGGGGVIYAVAANNDLMWYRHDGRNDGSSTWAAGAQGKKISVNWDFKRLFSSGGGVIYALTANNDLLWFRHDGYTDGSDRWTDTKGRGVGSGWAVKEVFSGATLAP